MVDALRWFLIYYCMYFHSGYTQHDAALAAAVDVAQGVRG